MVFQPGQSGNPKGRPVRPRTEASRENQRRYYQHKKYKIAKDIVAAMYGDAPECWCCGNTAPGPGASRWCIDHDHVTGVVRGLLYQICNSFIGLGGDNVEGLMLKIDQATRYLKGSRYVELLRSLGRL